MNDKENTETLSQRVLKIGEELAYLEMKLQTDKRTVKDIIRHIELVKELRSL